MQRKQEDFEFRTRVKVQIVPMIWLENFQTTDASLFEFVRKNNNKMKGSLLLDAIFLSFWND